MALIDARGCGVDNDEHLRGKVVAAAIENDARHKDGFGFIGVGALIEVQRGQAMLAINDQKFFFGFLQMANGLLAIEGLESQLLGSEEEDRSRNRGLAHSGLVEI